MSSTTIAQRLPSTKPIDHRWDRSRGLIFASARRDFTWSSSNSTAFSAPAGQTRGYALRPLKSDKPAERPASPQQTVRGPSMMDNPNRAPVFRPVARTDDLKRLGNEKDRLKEQLEQASQNMAILDRQLAELQADKDHAEQLRQRTRDTLAQTVRDHEASIKTAREEEREAVHKRMSAEVRKVKRQSEEAVQEAETNAAKQKKEEVEHLKQTISQALTNMKQRMEKEHEHELRALTRQRDKRKNVERSSYNNYRKVFDDLGAALASLTGHETSVERACYAGVKFHDGGTPYTKQIEKLQPWAKHKYPKLLQELDQLSGKHQERAEQAANELKTLRLEQLDIQEALNGAAHASRILTRYHRLEDQNKLTAANNAYWMANDQPFRERRDQIKLELRQIGWRNEQDKGKSSTSLYADEKHRLERMIRTLNELVSLHMRVRDVEALRALLTDSLPEKEAFARTVAPLREIEEAASAWTKVTREEPYAEEDSEVSVRDQRTLRSAYASNARQARERLRDFENLVRKRSLLQQMLGQAPEGREKELDALIREQILVKRGRERQAFAEIGLGRPSSFARRASMPLSEPSESFRPVGRLARRAVASAPPPEKTETKASKLARRKSDEFMYSTHIATPKKKLSTNDIPSAREAISREIDARRLNARKRSLFSLEAKREAVFKEESPNQYALHRFQRNIENLKAVANTNEIKTSKRDSPLRGRRRARRKGETAETPLHPGSRSLDLKATAPMQAAHTFWPAGFRRFHGDTGWREPPSRDYEASQEQWSSTSLQCFMFTGSGRESAQSTLDNHPPGLSSFADFRTALNRTLTGASEHGAEAEGRTSDVQEASRAQKAGTDASGVASSSAAASNVTEPEAKSEQSENPELLPEMPLTYQIPPDDYRKAAMASRNTSAAYWSYKLYKDPDGSTPSLHYCRSHEQAESQLQHFVGEPVLGFDIEWEPHFLKNKTPTAKHNVSLIQVASESRICLIHVANFVGTTQEQLMPPTLRSILESDQVIKAGVNIQGDAKRIEQWLGVVMKGQFELSHLYKVVTFAKKDINKALKGAALDAQVQSILLLPLKKGDVRTSSWSKPLSKEQADYSASDAYAGFRLYHALEARRKLMKPMPPRPAFYELQTPLVLGDGTVLRPQPRKARAPADAEKVDELDEEADEEFFDAVEEQGLVEKGDVVSAGVPLTSVSVTYPALPPLGDASAIPNAEGETPACSDPATMPNDKAIQHAKLTIAPSKRSQLPASAPAEVERAHSWVTTWKASLPVDYKCTAGNSSLRAYHMWHVQGFDVNRVAELAREPPLARVTVASYILEVIKTEDLPYDADRAKEVLDAIPGSVHFRYRKVIETVNT